MLKLLSSSQRNLLNKNKKNVLGKSKVFFYFSPSSTTVFSIRAVVLITGPDVKTVS